MLLGKPAGLRVAIDGDVLIETLTNHHKGQAPMAMARGGDAPCPCFGAHGTPGSECPANHGRPQERLTRAAGVDESSTQAQGEDTQVECLAGTLAMHQIFVPKPACNHLILFVPICTSGRGLHL